MEANKLSFLRRLVANKVPGLRYARFHLGDCQLWLENRPDRDDFVVQSGILYHMQDPVRFLDAVATRTDALFL